MGLFIIGTGARARVEVEVAQQLHREIKGFVEILTPERVGTSIGGLPVLCMVDDLGRYYQTGDTIMVSYGDIATQVKLRNLLIGCAYDTLVSPFAYVSPSVRIPKGVAVYVGANISIDVTLGHNVKVDGNSLLGHNCIVDEFCNIGASVCISGSAHIRARTVIGNSSVVLCHVTVGEDTIIGAGSVVTKDIPNGVIAFGNPARIHRRI